MLAMNQMQVHEDSIKNGWSGEETEKAYLGTLDGYDTQDAMTNFNFSNLQIALGQPAEPKEQPDKEGTTSTPDNLELSGDRSPDAAPREESQPRRDENGKPQYEYDDGRNARNEGNTLWELCVLSLIFRRHVSNLSSRTLERDLEDIFSKFGKVTGVKIPVDRYNENRLWFCATLIS